MESHARALGDKIDAGMVLRPVTPDRLKLIRSIITSTGKTPTVMADVYKLRRSQYRRVRLFIRADFGIMRMEDCFITDEFFNLLPVETIYSLDVSAILTPEQVAQVVGAPVVMAPEKKKLSITNISL